MKNMGIALLIISGVILFGILARFPYAVWLIIDIGIAITCGVIGMKLLKIENK